MSSRLSKYFTGVGIKRLSQVEVVPETSNQHEFNGISELRKLFGTEKKKFDTTFIALSDERDEVRNDTGTLTWYDARENHPVRSEFRLYYSTNEVISSAKSGDLIVVAKTDEDKLVVITAPQNSTSEKQMLWLFGQSDPKTSFTVKDLVREDSDVGFAERYIISTLGLSDEESDPEMLEALIRKFGKRFPSTREFSAYARGTVRGYSAIEEPDETLIAWIEREERLFKTLEKVFIKEQLEKGFGSDGTDVEEFISFSLSIQNRRKSRAGFSFENNLSEIFTLSKIRFDRGATTERNNKPDFIFPGIVEYHAKHFDIGLLTMLGLKTTAKDRWRQVLSEAEKIKRKHLITLEPAISRNQTEEMKANNLQLVIPKPLQHTFSPSQKKELLSVAEFIIIVKDKQEKSDSFRFGT